MLNQLSIKNFILIEDMDVSFSHGFSVLTGESGSGKTIILGAIHFLLGAKVNTNIIAINKEKCVVEGVFTENGKDEIIIRRELRNNGKSRFFVNDDLTPYAAYKEITKNLIDIHSQNQSALLDDDDYIISVVDDCAHNLPLLEKYKVVYGDWIKLQKELNDIELLSAQSVKDKDYLTFQLEQLNNAELNEKTLESLEKEEYTLRNAENIKTALTSSIQLLVEDNIGALSLLNKCDIPKSLPELSSRLDSIKIEIKDIVYELEKYYNSIDTDSGKLQMVQDKLNTLNALFHKHNVKSITELIRIRDDYAKKLTEMDSYDDRTKQLKSEIKIKYTEVVNLGNELSSQRQNQCADIQEYLLGNLVKLGIEHPHMSIKVLPTSEYTINGRDEVEFLFSANEDMPLQKFSSIASGGERSRLMLCIKSLIADSDKVPTIIFDEIDTGVSGQVAIQIAHLMKEIAQKRQVIAITHLPQVASQASTHYKVYKKVLENGTHTYIRQLQKEERVLEIANMLAGDVQQPEVLANAKYFMENG